MKFLKILTTSLLLLAVAGCAGVPINPTIHSSMALLGAKIDAVDETGSPALTVGLGSSTSQITPNESTGGEVLEAEWIEGGEALRNPDGTLFLDSEGNPVIVGGVTIHDQRSTCSVSTGNVAAEFGFGGGELIHVTGTGNGSPELCEAAGQWLLSLSGSD